MKENIVDLKEVHFKDLQFEPTINEERYFDCHSRKYKISFFCKNKDSKISNLHSDLIYNNLYLQRDYFPQNLGEERVSVSSNMKTEPDRKKMPMCLRIKKKILTTRKITIMRLRALTS